MRDITFTSYPCPTAVTGNQTAAPWSKWIEILTTHEQRGFPSDRDDPEALDRAKAGPCIVLGPVAGSRKNANVRSIEALALDIEGRPEDEVLAALRRLEPFEHVWYTTHRHGSAGAPTHPRLRVILPLAEPIPPEAHRAAWLGLNRLAGGINDPKTKDLARLHYLPSTFDIKIAESAHHEGRWLTLEDLPADTTAPPATTFDDQALASAAKKVRGLAREFRLREPLLRLFQGTPFAEGGDRHTKICETTWWLASSCDRLTPDTVRALFAPSLKLMGHDAPPPDEAITAYEGAVEKLERELKPEGSYTQEELQAIAQTQGWAVDDLNQKWIIQRGGACWMLTADGYVGPFVKDDVILAIRAYLTRAPVRLLTRSKDGIKPRPMVEIAHEAATPAERAIADLTVQIGRFDIKTKTIHEAVRPMRNLTPQFDEQIDRWLRHLAGANYPKLVDWLSCVPDLNKLLCAVYLDGAPSSGKTLLAHGLAKIWTEGAPADIDLVLGDFNDELARCPIVLADEEIPKRTRTTVTATLRSMLSTTTRTLKRKYLPPSELRGAVRLILAANNEFLLKSGDVSSSQDLEAIAQRFLYLNVPEEAALYLGELPRELKQEWAVSGIARHCLWLAEHHTIEAPGKRFWVEGDISQMHRLLITATMWNSFVCEWLVRYVMQPELLDSKCTGLVKVGGGELLVNVQAIIDGWTLYLKSTLDPDTTKIGMAATALSTGRKQLVSPSGEKSWFLVIDHNHLLSWSDSRGIGDRDRISERIGTPEPVPF